MNDKSDTREEAGTDKQERTCFFFECWCKRYHKNLKQKRHFSRLLNDQN